MTETIKIGFSSCPNDAFMMAALISGKVGIEGINFEPEILDIENLNFAAQEGNLDVLKMSVNAYPMASTNYQMLCTGAAIGTNNGPLLVCLPGNEEKIKDTMARVVVPGMHTTANLLMTIFYPEIQDKTAMLFSEIEDAVLRGDFEAGVIIHESRFTYKEKGLAMISDFGALWQQQNNCALALGCFAVKRKMPRDHKKAIEDAIRKSIMYAYEHIDEVMPYIKEHAQSLDEKTILDHIRTYVNHYSVSLGNEGISAIRSLFRRAKHSNGYSLLTEPIFID